MSTELPPLPETDYGLCFYDEGGAHEATGEGYTAEQMRAYARMHASNAVVAAVRERDETILLLRMNLENTRAEALLAVEAEREACARLCEQILGGSPEGALNLGDAIRQRGKQ